MNLSSYYWWFKSAIPPRICDDIIKYGLQHKEDRAITGGQGRDRDLKKQPLNKKEIKDLKVQMSEYLSVRTRGAGSVS